VRQRTKIGTRFGVRHQHAAGETFVEHTTFEAEADALTTEQEAERRARVQLARCRKQKRGCKFVRAVSYRLAPLVELPAWDSLRRGDHDTWETFSEDLSISAAAVHAREGMWIGVVEADGNEARTEHTTIDEARAACESRLRELGYKVAKAKSVPKLSAEARAARAPRSPEELVGALQDRIHDASGALIAAGSVKSGKGGKK